MTYVTCPTIRYHPAIVAQKAATLGLLSDNRFTLGLGAGENLNEHVVGGGWPSVRVRQEMLAEAIEIIGGLFDGEHPFDYTGQHFRVESGRLWDLPEQRVPVAAAVSGERSIARFAPMTDHLVAVEPEAEPGAGLGEGAVGRRQAAVAHHRPDPGVLGPRRGRLRADRPRAVPLVRGRLGRERRPADHARLRGRDAVRAPRGRRRVDPLRPRRVEDRRGREAVLGGRVQRRRPRAGGRRLAVGVPAGGRVGDPACTARGVVLVGCAACSGVRGWVSPPRSGRPGCSRSTPRSARWCSATG
nr:LLM class flavin-dependent oxidoreductase [Angustibacter aerolatus]